MLPDTPQPKTTLPTAFFLHYLGGSAEEWVHVVKLLEGELDCITIDLPGFGSASATPGYSVSEMVDFVSGIVHAKAPAGWLLAGHSMGAKIAAAVARRAEDGDMNLQGLSGLVLIAGSPPGPEPMKDDQRDQMLDWFRDDAKTSLLQAQQYIAQNVCNPLTPAITQNAVADVLRADVDAWVAWLQSGSREDWSKKIGVLKTPAMVIAGAEDAALGPDAQRLHMMPHFADANLQVIPNAKHLLPLEYPREIAQLILEHADVAGNTGVAAGRVYLALINSRRVGAITRSALLDRLKPVDALIIPAQLTPLALQTLRAMLQWMLPQNPPGFIDIAASIDAMLEQGKGDGWRRAELPPDRQAYAIALLTLDEQARRQYGLPLHRLDAFQQDVILSRIGDNATDIQEPPSQDRFTAAQLALWFADFRADAVQIYTSHPATLQAMGYSGIANGGDGMPKTGFVLTGADEKEDWEPVARQERHS